MAITDNKACWNCLKKTMVLCPELGAEWFKCSKCGATYIDMPKQRAPVLKTGTDMDGAGFKTRTPRVPKKHKVVE